MLTMKDSISYILCYTDSSSSVTVGLVHDRIFHRKLKQKQRVLTSMIGLPLNEGISINDVQCTMYQVNVHITCIRP